MRRKWSHVFVLVAFLFAAYPAAANDGKSAGKTVYVPAYSHVFFGDREHSLNVTATLSIRNADLERKIIVESVRYHDENGKLLRSYLDKPRELAPLSSMSFVVKESDVSGGYSPSFVVVWRSEAPAVAPVVQSVMIGAIGSQGISIVCDGVPVR